MGTLGFRGLGERIFRARRVVTLSGGSVEAIAVRGEYIYAIGAADELVDRFPKAERIDLGNVVIVPGFNDAHQHITMTADNLLHLDLSPLRVSTLTEVKNAIRARADVLAPGRWIRGAGFDNTKVAGGSLTRFELDQAAPRHPVCVIHVACHWGVANSEALRLGGITEESAAPPGGDFGRDGAGRLNGILYEQALFDYVYPALARGNPHVPPSSREDRVDALQRASHMFHSAGITSVGDALVGPDEIDVLQEASRRGVLKMRVNMLLAYPHFDKIASLGIRHGFGDHHLRLGGIKLFVDGAIAGKTCLVDEPFEGTNDHGMQTMSREELTDIINRIHRYGMRLAIHANGDRAIRLVLDILADVERSVKRPRLHHRIEHCTIVDQAIVRRLQDLEIIVVPFGNYVMAHGEKLLAWYGEDRLHRMFAHRTFLDAGITVAGSSDYPCGPYQPLLAIQGCVTREGPDGVSYGDSQRISTLEAMRLYTVGSATASGESQHKGLLKPGFLADFVALDENPLKATPDSIASIPIRATFVGGEQVWPSRC